MTGKAAKAHTHAAGMAFMRAFIAAHGHSHIPPGTTSDGADVSTWWMSMRAGFKNATLTPEATADVRELLGLGADLLTDRERERVLAAQRENLEPFEIKRFRSVIQAVRDFGGVHGHTQIPYFHKTQRGEEPVGRVVAAWRRAYADGRLNTMLITRLEAIPGWTWDGLTAPAVPRVEIPADTTQMDQPGLRQFLGE